MKKIRFEALLHCVDQALFGYAGYIVLLKRGSVAESYLDRKVTAKRR